MKRATAAILTLVLLAVMVRWRVARSPSDSAYATPVECLQSMFDSAARGDVERYLSCFSQSERTRLTRDLGGDPVAASRALQRSIAELKGWALTTPPPAGVSVSCSVSVEWVFAQRIDRQRLELRQINGFWQIASVDQVRPTQPVIPYGTPVFLTPLPEPNPMPPGSDKSSHVDDGNQP